MKKKMIVLSVLFFMVLNMNVHAGFLVADLTNIIQQIENGYTLVANLQASYENIKNNIKRLEETYKRMENFDWSTVDPRNMTLEDLKTAEGALGPVYGIMSFGNSLMNVVNDFENIINDPGIKIGNASFSIADVFTNPESIGREAKNYMWDDVWKMRTPEENAAFFTKYGMSYGNSMKYYAVADMIQEVAMTGYAYADALEVAMSEDQDENMEAMVEAMKADSLVQQAQQELLLQKANIETIRSTSLILGKLLKLKAVKANQKEEASKAEQEAIPKKYFNSIEMVGKVIDERNEKKVADKKGVPFGK